MKTSLYQQRILDSIDAQETALLVIDMQRDFCEFGGYADSAGLDVGRLRVPIPRIAQLLAWARQSGARVIYTREGHRPDLSDCPPLKRLRSLSGGAAIGSAGPFGRLLVRGEYGHDIIDELAPRPGEVVIDKPGYCAFHQTDLELILRTQRVRHLILAGVTTEVCVASTLRGAVERGFACITVGDACASSSPELHAATLASIGVEGGIFGAVADTAGLLHNIEMAEGEES